MEAENYNGIWVFTDYLPDEEFLEAHPTLPTTPDSLGLLQHIPNAVHEQYDLSSLTLPGDMKTMVAMMQEAYRSALKTATLQIATNCDLAAQVEGAFIIAHPPEQVFSYSPYMASLDGKVTFGVDPRKIQQRIGNFGLQHSQSILSRDSLHVHSLQGMITVPFTIVPYTRSK